MENARARIGELIARQAGREPLNWVMFWGHTPKAKDQIGKWCLSQWYPAAFEVDGARYVSTEQYMMAGKARLFDDGETLEQILAEPDPGKVKALGRKVRGFDSARWEAERFAIVTQGNIAKFSQNPPLRAYLLGTADAILVEASPKDRIWGIGLAEDHEHATQPPRWRGLNLLGFALMDARAAILAGDCSASR